MLKRILVWVSLSAALVFVGGGIVVIVSSSQVFQECVQKAGTGNEQPVPEYMRFVPPAVVNRYFCTGTFIDENDDAIIALFTVVLAVSTIALWWSTRRLWKFAREQSIDMKAAVNVAETANELNRKWFVADRRPWVGIIDAKITGQLASSGPSVTILLEMRLKNFGNSPAERVVIVPRIFAFEETNAAAQFSKRIPTTTVGDSVSTIFPDQDVSDNIGVIRPIPSDPIKPTHSGIIAGCVSYSFAGSATRKGTPFAYVLSRKDGAPLITDKDTMSNPEELDIFRISLSGSPT